MSLLTTCSPTSRARAPRSRRWSSTSTRRVGARRRPPGLGRRDAGRAPGVDRRGRGGAATDKPAWDAVVLRRSGTRRASSTPRPAPARRHDAADILERWRRPVRRCSKALRDYPEGQRMPWFGPPMSPTSMATARFMETWAHSLDVAEALGHAHQPTDRIRHVAHLGVRTAITLTRARARTADRGVPGRAGSAVR